METLTTGYLGSMLLGWVVLTVLWLALLGYRSLLAGREEDQMFLSKGAGQAAADQRALVGKLMRLSKPIWALGIVDGALIVLILGLWLWQGLQMNP